jgi:hypothetical protein
VEVNRDAHLTDLATALTNHAVRLAEAGHQTGALAASEEAVTLCRELVELNPEAHLPNLATSLWTFASVRQIPGAETAAIGAVKESTAIFSSLASTQPGVFEDRLDAIHGLLNELERKRGSM